MQSSPSQTLKNSLICEFMTQSSTLVASLLDMPTGPEIERRRLPGRKRRGLVLTDESASHPFRAELPPHITQDLFEIESDEQSFWQLTREDVRGFASVYFSVFAAVLVFIM
jgi:hypothetical protein